MITQKSNSVIVTCDRCRKQEIILKWIRDDNPTEEALRLAIKLSSMGWVSEVNGNSIKHFCPECKTQEEDTQRPKWEIDKSLRGGKILTTASSGRMQEYFRYKDKPLSLSESKSSRERIRKKLLAGKELFESLVNYASDRSK